LLSGRSNGSSYAGAACGSLSDDKKTVGRRFFFYRVFFFSLPGFSVLQRSPEAFQ